MANTLRVDNPFTGEIVFETGLHDREAVDAAMRRAQQAHLAFRSTTIADRIALVHRFVAAFEAKKPVYAQEITASMGKPLPQALGEIDGMFDRARTMAGIAEEALAPIVLPEQRGFERSIHREPVGVAVILAAWNYPLLIACNPLIPAILAGNAVVLKHSSRTPRCSEQFVEAFRDAGAPEGLVQAVHTDHETASFLVQHPLAGFVSFTGSVAGGRRIYRDVAEKRFIDVALELGGKDAAYVAADCYFEETVMNVMDGVFYNAGQSCCGVERIYVERPLYGRFLEAAEAIAKSQRLGDPTDERTTMGPMAQANAPAFLAGQVEAAVKQDGKLMIGGAATDVDGRGRFFQPTIVADTDLRMAIEYEESFGPVVAIAPVDTDDEAIARMNGTVFGLTGSIWSADFDRAKRLASQVEAGTVFVNRADYLDPLLAWTGYHDSGKGVSLSKLGFLSVTKPKSYHFRERW